MTVVTRFAPSPTGDLHLGHAFSARFACDVAARTGGRFLVRIEDIDRTRCRPQFVARNLFDLEWLGLSASEPILQQSDRMEAYAAALGVLQELGLVYPCFCSRKQIRQEIEAAGAAPQADAGPGTLLYPGLCRDLGQTLRQERLMARDAYALRLDTARASAMAGPLTWTDRMRGRHLCRPDVLGDVVIARRELPTSYHLAVVVDDAAQGVTEVTRGEDLLEATHVHRLLYAVLGLPEPAWHHHPLCRDAAGRRLAKRAEDVSIAALRDAGHGPDQVLAMASAAAA